MNKEKIKQALQSEKYNDLLAVFNHYKNEEAFKQTLFKFDKFFNNAKPVSVTDMHFAMLRARMRDVLRIMDQSNYIAKEAEIGIGSHEIGKVKTLKFGDKNEDLEPLDGKKPITKTKSGVQKIGTKPKIDPEKLPADLQKLYYENSALETKIKSKHAKMRLMKNKNQAKERKDLLVDMEAMRQKQNESWKKIDAWWDTNINLDNKG